MKTQINFKSIKIYFFVALISPCCNLFSQNATPVFNPSTLIKELNETGVPKSDQAAIVDLYKADYGKTKTEIWTLPPIHYRTTDSTGACVNTNFEDSTFNGWNGSTGHHPLHTPGSGCCPNNGFATNTKHTIITTQGTDVCGGFPLLPNPSRRAVIRLGQMINNPGGTASEISQSFKVTPENTGFTYWFAVVLQDGGHTTQEQPAFEAIIFDKDGDTIPCSRYYVAGGQGINGFQTCTVAACNSSALTPSIYKPWSTVTTDLSAYLNQTVTVRFRVFDCMYTAHWGYVYLTADCFKSEIPDPYFCDGWNPDSVLNFTAPTGYSSYLWLKNSDTISSDQNIVALNPKLGDKYTVILTPYHTGNDSCGISLDYEIKLKPHPDLPTYCPLQNIFTPNGDGKNEKYTTHDYSWISTFDIKIYDRWGKLMFESDNPYKEWDGKTKGGDKADDGVYYWHSSYVSSCYPESEPIVCKGFVHLLK